MENFSPIFAQRLKELRKSKGLSLSKLSDALQEKYDISISEDSLTNYEVAIANEYHSRKMKNQGMSVKNLRYLADFYQVSTDFLLGIVNEPSRDGDMQSACSFTGLSNHAVEVIRGLGDQALRALNYLLEEPLALSFLLDIYNLALEKSVWQYAKDAEDKAIHKSDSRDYTEKLCVELETQEKCDVREYRLVMQFKKMLDSITQRLGMCDDFQKYGARMAEAALSSDNILLLRHLMQGGQENAVNPSEGN